MVQIADDLGIVTKTYVYDAFGNERDRNPNDLNPWRYCGEYWDGETGTYYLRFRHYDPSIGRFITADTHWNVGNMIYGDNPQDPLGLGVYVPSLVAIWQSGNLYVYCMNNPVMYIDSSGLIFKAIGNAIKNVFNAVVNTAIDHVTALTGNSAEANQIGNILKMGDGKTTTEIQAAVNELSKYEVTLGVSVGVGVGHEIIGIQAGIGSTASIHGTKDYVFVGGNAGLSFSDIKKIQDYFLPFGIAIDFDMRMIGSDPYITHGFLHNWGMDTFMGSTGSGVVLSSDIGFSYGGNYYWIRAR